MQTEFNISELLSLLELPINALDGIQKARSIPVVQKELDQFKQVVKQQKKELSKKYHPDTGGDEERMKEINNICDWILGSEIMMIPKPQPIVRHYYSYFGGTSSATSTGCATPGAFFSY